MKPSSKNTQENTKIPKDNYFFWLTAGTLGYFLLALLGLLITIPPGFSSAMWPAAGLAVGMIMIGGPKFLPAVFLGSFFGNMTHTDLQTVLSAPLSPIMIALQVAAGATLQAYVAFRLAGGGSIHL